MERGTQIAVDSWPQRGRVEVGTAEADELVVGDPDSPRYVWWEGKLRPVPGGLPVPSRPPAPHSQQLKRCAAIKPSVH